MGIKSDMKRNYPNVDHKFDVWHLAKSVTKKLTEKANNKTVVNFHLGLSQSQIIFGGVLTLIKETRNYCGKSGYHLSTTMQILITGTLQTCIMSDPTHLSLEMLPEQRGGYGLGRQHRRRSKKWFLTKPF